ncbi:MAG: hypothetical protein V1698_00580 [bacterium]
METAGEKIFFKDKVVLAAIFCALTLNVILWIILKKYIRPSALPIILHYNVYFGADYLGKFTKVFVIPLVGLIIFAVNTILSGIIFLKFKLGAKILLIASSVAQALLLVGAITIIMFNK